MDCYKDGQSCKKCLFLKVGKKTSNHNRHQLRLNDKGFMFCKYKKIEINPVFVDNLTCTGFQSNQYIPLELF